MNSFFYENSFFYDNSLHDNISSLHSSKNVIKFLKEIHPDERIAYLKEIILDNKYTKLDLKEEKTTIKKN